MTSSTYRKINFNKFRLLTVFNLTNFNYKKIRISSGIVHIFTFGHPSSESDIVSSDDAPKGKKIKTHHIKIY